MQGKIAKIARDMGRELKDPTVYNLFEFWFGFNTTLKVVKEQKPKQPCFFCKELKAVTDQKINLHQLTRLSDASFLPPKPYNLIVQPSQNVRKEKVCKACVKGIQGAQQREVSVGKELQNTKKEFQEEFLRIWHKKKAEDTPVKIEKTENLDLKTILEIAKKLRQNENSKSVPVLPTMQVGIRETNI